MVMADDLEKKVQACFVCKRFVTIMVSYRPYRRQYGLESASGLPHGFKKTNGPRECLRTSGAIVFCYLQPTAACL